MRDARVIKLARLLGVLLACVVLLGAWTAHVSVQGCERTNRISIVIQQLGKRGLKTIGTKGSAGYAYYKAHPAELVVARKQLREQVTEFAPAKCSGIF